MQIHAANISEFRQAAVDFSAQVNWQGKNIFLLSGDLGTGKTEWVKSCLKSLGGIDVVSPSFSLHQQYRIRISSTGSEFLIDHWDLYRLESEDELESSGFWDQFYNDQYSIFIEWSERIPLEFLPKGAVQTKINISANGQNRTIEITSLN